MADFVAVLRNAIDGLNDNRPSIREKVYQRARITLEKRLAVVGPTPAAVAERHKGVLEAAIAKVESFYACGVEDVSVAGAGSTTVRASTATGDLPTAEFSPPANDVSETASRSGDLLPPPVAVAQDTAGLFVCPRTYPVPIVVEGNARLGNSFCAVSLADSEATFVRALAGGLVQASFHELGWATSGACAVCQKWALCIDQTQCWHRADPAARGCPTIRDAARTHRVLDAQASALITTHTTNEARLDS